jgi:glycosyltransferase involved in cell wall biosynthesis
MRIALVHSFYVSSSPSGENDVVIAQAEALRAAGHEVALIARSSDDLEPGFVSKAGVAIRVATGRGASPVDELAAFRPDVVHVHNLFPNFGRRWVDEWDGPIVVTLHNFRHSCAAGTFYRDGAPCTDCLDHGSSASAVHACYRGSVAATLPLTVATRGGARGNHLLGRADAVIALSDRAAGLHIASGVRPARVSVLPNFVAAHTGAGADRSGWLYVGRLAPEKGVLELAAAWPGGTPLTMLGTGPLESELTALARRDVHLGGLVPPAEVQPAMARARGVVFPSRWAEGAVPVVYLQALAAGTPVIAWQGSSAADDVVEGGTGTVVNDWAELPDALRRMDAGWHGFAAAARARFETRYAVDRWLERVERLYEGAIEARGPRTTVVAEPEAAW